MHLWANGPIAANALQKLPKFLSKNARSLPPLLLAKKSQYKFQARNCEYFAKL